jgi:hypothetical protein
MSSMRVVMTKEVTGPVAAANTGRNASAPPNPGDTGPPAGRTRAMPADRPAASSPKAAPVASGSSWLDGASRQLASSPQLCTNPTAMAMAAAPMRSMSPKTAAMALAQRALEEIRQQ